jgi:hypothetical protein
MDRLTQLPKSSLLWFLDYIQRTHSTPPLSPGDETVIELVQEIRDYLSTSSTLENEILTREKTRWIETKKQMREIMGEVIFGVVNEATEGTHDNIVTAAHLLYDALVIAGDTQPDFIAYRARMRKYAATAALLPNIRDIATEGRRKMKELSKDNENTYITRLYRGEIALAQMGEDFALKLSEYIGQKGLKVTGEGDDAWRAIVRYRADGKPKSAAQIALLLKDCFPVVFDKAVQLREALEPPGGQAWANWILHHLSVIGSEQRLDTIVKSLAAVRPEAIKDLGSNESNGQLKKSFEHELKSNAVSLLLRLLPHVQFPPIEGERDGVDFVVKNLSLSHLHVDERNIRFTINHTLGQIRRGDPFLKIMVDDVSATLQGMNWEFKQTHFPYLSGSGLCDAQVGGVGVVLGFQIIKRPRSKASVLVVNNPLDAATATTTTTTNSKSSTNNSNSATTTTTNSSTTDPLIPQIVLGVTRVFIDHVKLDLKDSIYMTLADMFSKSIRVYLTSLVEDRIVDIVTDVLDRFNQKLAKEGWDVLDAAFDWNLDPIPTEELAAKRATQLDAPVTARKDAYSVSFATEGSLGIMLSKHHEFVVVKGFKSGPKGEALPGEACGKIKIGDVLIGFNGGEITSLPLDRVMARLSRSRRPLTLTFHPGDGSFGGGGGAGAAGSNNNGTEKIVHVQEFKFMEEKLHLILKARPLEDRGAVVTGFRDPPDGGQGPAQKAGVPVGWVIAEVNKQDTLRKTFKETTALLAIPQRPITLKFVRDCDTIVEMKNEKPIDLKVASFSVNNKKLVVVSSLETLTSPAEIALKDKIESGDFISSVNGEDCMMKKFDDVINLIRTASKNPPIELTFSRFGVGSSVAAVVAKASLSGPSLGLVFYKSSTDGKCCFKSFQGVPGPVGILKIVQVGYVLLKIDGVSITDEEMAKNLLENKIPPYSMVFRDMDAYGAGGWGKQ